MKNFTILHTLICKNFKPSSQGYDYFDVTPSIATKLPFNISDYYLVASFLINDTKEHSFEVLFSQNANPRESLWQISIPNTARPFYSWGHRLPSRTIDSYCILNFEVLLDGDPDNYFLVPLVIEKPLKSGVRHLRM